MTLHLQQHTLATPAGCSGVGVHSGKTVNLTILPAPVNYGIKFRRIDLPNNPCVAAIFKNVVDTSLATVIGAQGCIISTIEHLMASLSGLSIDNALIEVDAYELPIMDGSAGPFTDIIKKAGFKKQDALRHFFVIKTPVELQENEKYVGIFPAPDFKISYTIEYDHPLINRQSCSFEITDDVFSHEICRARTFGFYHEVEMMKRYGLARGGSLDNAVVIDKNKILNTGGLRYKDEFVRHKVLDCIGDLSLLGMPILGHVIAKKSGHTFNHAVLDKIFADKNVWETKTIST